MIGYPKFFTTLVNVKHRLEWVPRVDDFGKCGHADFKWTHTYHSIELALEGKDQYQKRYPLRYYRIVTVTTIHDHSAP